MTKRSIYLAQINNTFGRNAFLPYSVALLWSYARQFPEIEAAYELAGFQFLRDPIPEAVARIEDADVVGLSAYIWNWEYTKALARAVRSANPDCLIVVGGPQAPADSRGFFEEHPYFDVIVHYEGERIFADLLRERLSEAPDYSRVDGITCRGPNGETVTTPLRDRIADLEEVPSPYLTGVFDDLLDLPYDFHASQETHRGCPYSCTFCDWGSAVFTKVRRFSDERLRSEIDWFADRRIELLYNCDANFGIFPRDEAIVDWMVEAKQRVGYPQKFRAAYAKKSGERVFNISKKLNEHGMSKGATLSLQSLNTDTLDRIKRTNIHFDNFRQLIRLYEGDGLPTYTELIMGLPGETRDSFMEGIDAVLDAGQHDGLFIFPCMALPNSELSDPGYVAREGIKTVSLPIMLVHGTPSDDGLREMNDIVVETSCMSFQDWRTMYAFSWSIQAFHCLGPLQDIARYLRLAHDLPYSTFYRRLLDFVAVEPEGFIAEEKSAFDGVLDRVLDGGDWTIVLPEFGEITWPPEEATFLRIARDYERFYAEAGRFLEWLARTGEPEMLGRLSEAMREDLVAYQSAMLASYRAPKTRRFSLRHDLHAVLSDPDWTGEAPDAAPVRLEVVSGLDYADKPEDFARDVVWYGRKGGRFKPAKVHVFPEELTLPAGAGSGDPVPRARPVLQRR